MSTCDIGLIGLAVMGENLVLNMESRGFHVAVYNRTTSVVEEFDAARGKGKKFVVAKTLEEFVAGAEAPAQEPDHGQGRRAGGCGHRAARPAARAGRHHHRRRQHALDRHRSAARRRSKEKGIHFFGVGVSRRRRRRAARARASCPAARKEGWEVMAPIFERSPRRSTASRAAATWARTAPAIT